MICSIVPLSLFSTSTCESIHELSTFFISLLLLRRALNRRFVLSADASEARLLMFCGTLIVGESNVVSLFERLALSLACRCLSSFMWWIESVDAQVDASCPRYVENRTSVRYNTFYRSCQCVQNFGLRVYCSDRNPSSLALLLFNVGLLKGFSWDLISFKRQTDITLVIKVYIAAFAELVNVRAFFIVPGSFFLLLDVRLLWRDLVVFIRFWRCMCVSNLGVISFSLWTFVLGFLKLICDHGFLANDGDLFSLQNSASTARRFVRQLGN